MGISFSCPLADDLDSRLESYLVRSTSFGSDDVKPNLRSISFNDRDSKPGIMKSVGSTKMMIEGSVSFKGRDLDTMIALRSPPTHVEDNVTLSPVSKKSEKKHGQLSRENSTNEKSVQTLTLPKPGHHRHQAALRLQKTYKSFRTRRQLADCAVLVEQRWWKILDFAVLKRSSISFFEIEKPETAISRWSRARTRAAKVGKGLSKDEKARQLALQHWLEAIDPRHRYGHNLQFYYVKWLHCESKQPFFYWLDVGEGREVSLDRCPRLKLHQQCIKYLGPIERKDYEVAVVNGNFIYKHSGMPIHTTGGPEDAKWIFVLSVSRILYVGLKKKGTFQHSSFLAGGATLSAGRLVVENGILKAVWPHSGHYLPTEENFEAFLSFLLQNNVDLTVVQRSPGNDEEVSFSKSKKESGMRSSVSEPDFGRIKGEDNTKKSERKKTNSRKQYYNDTENMQPPLSRRWRGFSSKLTTLEIPNREYMFEMFRKAEQQAGPIYRTRPSVYISSSDDDGYETAEEFLSDEDFMVSKHNLFDEGEYEEYEEPAVPEEKIIQRLNSHKGMRSYQLAQQLSCKWTTGAGPRIGCLRDYPSELQFRVLEEVSLSPRSSFSSPRRLPTGVRRETAASKSPLGLE